MVDELQKDWQDLNAELTKFEADHKEYVEKLDEVEKMKIDYFQKFEKYKKKLIGLKKTSEKCKSENEVTASKIENQISDNINYLNNISDTFPRKNGRYLRIIIGGVNVSILNKNEKWKYKEEYEKFKFFLTLLSLAYSFVLLWFDKYRALDAGLSFLLVWYYCTLTIRESILAVNGSNIQGWWRIHHFIATVCTAILLIWPDGVTYNMFRKQFTIFTFYLSFVQLLQYYYQSGCLYRLRALGEEISQMTTTTDGFQHWMMKGLSFILPFLFIGYFFQLYNAYVLFQISQLPECQEWQVLALSIIFFVLFLGNFFTTWVVIRKKIRGRLQKQIRDISNFRYKYIDRKNLLSSQQSVPTGDKTD